MKISTEFKSPNFDERKQHKVDTIILHTTHLSFAKSIDVLCSPKSKVSCHYIISLEGHIYQLVNDTKRAWHAGKSAWKNKTNLNHNSIGIEIVDTTDQGIRVHNFPEKQMNAVIWLCKNLYTKHNIPKFNVLAHSDVAPDRKDDPGQYFNWQELYSEGVGVFHDIDYISIPNAPIIGYGDNNDKVKAIQKLLHKLGFEIKADGYFGNKTCSVIIAFKRHFNPQHLEYIFSELDLAILKNILHKL